MGQTVLESPTGRGSDFDGDLPQVVGQIMNVSEGLARKDYEGSNGVESRGGNWGSAVTKQAWNHKSYGRGIERERERAKRTEKEHNWHNQT